ncbi:hypothetical protein GLOTRDRAFT_109273 [Gloeophyllum trabeum ATCC 11539]|uniref:Nudix hydrolase domain-containing protein n=1 Tax=Gloeophyllum trabeum (strain ATCC 11539 / FP-39264 / Madison 617) TaxID=670483 RepID=S7QNE9_GLOTA|nr:uncharacterized protein GLOTRDRAFT_109273 [Gloeophyllum trabeum ATCC 11539]EPQ61038.1 hypothetical protein GLOTRDRAFT_109273 [Gloeophyllum trabeum ATCC 11539]
MSDEPNIIPLLSRALIRIRSTPPRVIASPPTQPRRAAVSLIIRVVPSPSYPPPNPVPPPPQSLTAFFEQEWVNAPGARPEILFLRRDRPGSDGGATPLTPAPGTSASAAGEAHVAFPGGRMEEGDEGGLYTAMRQTWAETALDLAEPHYVAIGQLDDREITTSLGKRLLMILSPYVFLQVTPAVPGIAPVEDPVEGTTVYWVPLASLLPSRDLVGKEKKGKRRRGKRESVGMVAASPGPRWSTVKVDAASRLAPRNSRILKEMVRGLVGSMQFPAIVLDIPSAYSYADEKGTQALEGGRKEELKLWGLSLGMTLDLLAFMVPPSRPSDQRPPSPTSHWLPFHSDEVASVELVSKLAPSLTSVVPRFGYPDVNFWIWVFGKRYREVIRGWEASVRSGGTNDRRINWPGTALSTFYAAIRKALIVVIVVRAIAILLGVAGFAWWVFW